MQYYAKTYTADPKTGLLTPGEYLTEAQVAALGEDRIADMVKRGILCAAGEKPAKPQQAAKSETPAEKKAEKAAPAEEADAGEWAEAEEGDELPELDAAGAIDAEDEKPAAPAKKGGRRKTK